LCRLREDKRDAEFVEGFLLRLQPALGELFKAALFRKRIQEGINALAQLIVSFPDADRPLLRLEWLQQGTGCRGILLPVLQNRDLVVHEGVRLPLRHLNGAADCGEFIASSDAVELGEGLRAIAEDIGHEATLELAEDGLSARARCACRVERETEFTGDSTLERMVRFEGHGSHRFAEERVLATEFVKGRDGWRIAGARFV
jgi:hypothetical protein